MVARATLALPWMEREALQGGAWQVFQTLVCLDSLGDLTLDSKHWFPAASLHYTPALLGDNASKLDQLPGLYLLPQKPIHMNPLACADLRGCCWLCLEAFLLELKDLSGLDTTNFIYDL